MVNLLLNVYKIIWHISKNIMNWYSARFGTSTYFFPNCSIEVLLVNNNLFLFCPGRGRLFIIFSSLSLFNSNSLVINSSSCCFHVVSSYENFLFITHWTVFFYVIFSNNSIILERFDIFIVNIHHTEYKVLFTKRSFFLSLYSLLFLLFSILSSDFEITFPLCCFVSV